MLPFKLIYAEGYDLNLGNHVFPSQKFKWIRERCLADRLAAPEDFLEPQAAADDDVLLVHTREWVRKLKTGALSSIEVLRLEIPYSKKMVEAFWLSAGGAILASRRALHDGCGVNLGGGFHHAYADHGEGFCAINDVAVAIRALQKQGAISTAMVVDLDVHQGNGTAAIFGGDPSVFTLSMHQENNYPHPKPPSDIDVGLADFTRDDTYLHLLRDALDRAFDKFTRENATMLTSTPAGPQPRAGRGGLYVRPFGRNAEAREGVTPSPTQTEREAAPKETPDLLWYLAGADPYLEDQLGGLALTIEGLQERDRIVIKAARERGIPLAVTFAGGYARRVQDTVLIHTNTIRAAHAAYNLETTDEHG